MVLIYVREGGLGGLMALIESLSLSLLYIYIERETIYLELTT
jgi:hypothetical protein